MTAFSRSATQAFPAELPAPRKAAAASAVTMQRSAPILNAWTSSVPRSRSQGMPSRRMEGPPVKACPESSGQGTA